MPDIGHHSHHPHPAKVRLDGLRLLLIGLLLVGVTVLIARWLGITWSQLVGSIYWWSSEPSFILHGFWHIVVGYLGGLASNVGMGLALVGVIELVRGKTG